MNYDAERRNAEQRAKDALTERDWRIAAYNLYQASRMSLRLACASCGRTRTSHLQLAQRYRERADQAFARLQSGRNATIEAPSAEGDQQDGADETVWELEERPTTRLDHVAGMAELKEHIQHHIMLPIRYPEVYAQYGLQPGTGVLMYGPPGTGKTYVARAIAGEADAAFIMVDMKKVLSKWFGETEKLLGSLFEAARKHPRSVIFFDEAEALFPKRGKSNSSVMARVVPQLLQLINGLDARENTVFMLGATNRPWLMDEAAMRPGRFGNLVYVGLPDADAREAMIRQRLEDTPVDKLDYNELAQLTDGYSGADLAGDRDSICDAAKMRALKRTLERTGTTDEPPEQPEAVTMDDFRDELGVRGPSVKPADLERYEAFGT